MEVRRLGFAPGSSAVVGRMLWAPQEGSAPAPVKFQVGRVEHTYQQRSNTNHFNHPYIGDEKERAGDQNVCSVGAMMMTMMRRMLMTMMRGMLMTVMEVMIEVMRRMLMMTRMMTMATTMLMMDNG